MEAIHHYYRNTLAGLFIEGVIGIKNALDRLVNTKALQIFLQILVSLPLLYAHPNLFALGLVIGFVFNKHVRKVVENVSIVYQAHQTLLEQLLFYIGGGYLAIYTMPTSTIFATLYYSSYWGALWIKFCQDRLRKQNIAPNDNPFV